MRICRSPLPRRPLETISTTRALANYEKTYTAAVSGTDFVNGAVTVTNVHEKGTLTIEKWIHIDDKNKIPMRRSFSTAAADNEKVTFAKDEFEWNEDGYYVASEQIFGEHRQLHHF